MECNRLVCEALMRHYRPSVLEARGPPEVSTVEELITDDPMAVRLSPDLRVMQEVAQYTGDNTRYQYY